MLHRSRAGDLTDERLGRVCVMSGHQPLPPRRAPATSIQSNWNDSAALLLFDHPLCKSHRRAFPPRNHTHHTSSKKQRCAWVNIKTYDVKIGILGSEIEQGALKHSTSHSQILTTTFHIQPTTHRAMRVPLMNRPLVALMAVLGVAAAGKGKGK